MALSLIEPLLLAGSLAAVLVSAFHRRLPPILAARLLASVTAVLAIAALPTLWIIAVGYLVHVPEVHTVLGWCAVHVGHHGTPATPIGVAATVAALYGTVRVAMVLRTYRRLRCDWHAAPAITPHPEPFALTLPGRGGHVVLSSALVELLDEEERAVVLAHEEAHGRCRHDRYLLLGKLATAALPLLRPLSTRLQYNLERWADEHAVARCGDRRFVAATLGKVALGSRPVRGVLGFHSVGIAGRVRALLGPPVTVPHRGWRALGLGALAVVGMSGLYQLHHVAAAISSLCAGA